MRIDRNSVAVGCVEELLGILTDMHRVSAFSRVNSLYWCIHVRPSCYSTVFSVYALYSLSGLLSARTMMTLLAKLCHLRLHDITAKIFDFLIVSVGFRHSYGYG